MPELPEVETTRRGLAPHVEGRVVEAVVLRRPDLRWPIPPEVPGLLPGQRIDAVRRRAKYLLLDTADGDYLYARSRGRTAPVKAFLMDQRIVVGVGNIYAAEALFAAGISPWRAAGRVSRARYVVLADAARAILLAAIERGGTTLRDFISPDGVPGYFEQELSVYGRGGEPCRSCGRPLRQDWIGQRASAWCAHCQR